jgi:hypothetical protein
MYMADRFATSGSKAKTKEGRRRANEHAGRFRLLIKHSHIALIKASFPFLAREAIAAHEQTITALRV